MSGVAIGVGVAVGGGLSYLGSTRAGEQQATAARDAAAVQREMFDISREDLLPFLEAGQAALPEFRAGIEQAPAVPTIPGAPAPQFAERGSRFVGDRFTYDPYEAMESPDIQFLREQGEQALLRQTAANRKLGSGNRLIDAIRFNQGLASQGLQDYFNRQRLMSEMNYGRALGENQLAYGRGLTEYGLDIDDYLRRRANILDQYGLQEGAYQSRLNRLGDIINVGARTGGMTSQGALSTGQQLANTRLALGQSQAASTLGAYNALGNMLGTGAYLYGMGAFSPQAQNRNFLQPVSSDVNIGFY